MSWALTLNVTDLVARWKNNLLTIPELADKVADRLEHSRWMAITPYPDTLKDRLNRLRQATNTVEYEAAFEFIYDTADDDRVCIICGG